MFFVHPQIKLNKRIFSAFFKAPDLDFLKNKLSLYYPNKQFVFTDMGRTAFKLIIEKMNLRNSNIIFPAYICDIFYPILKDYNIKPVFVDIKLDTFNIDADNVLEKINPNTKAVLVSHTYGLPTEMEKFKNIMIIEDCAHSFGAKYKDKFVGNFGTVSFSSLYKQFPSLRGGVLICPKDWHINIPETKFSFRDFVSFLNSFPFFAFLFKSFGSKAPTLAENFIRKEKANKPAGINSVSLNLFSQYLEDFDKRLEKRKRTAVFFQQKLKEIGFEVQDPEANVFCYVSGLMPKKLKDKRDKLVAELKKEKVFCTRIWHTPIILNKQVQKEYGINLNEFPNTVEASERVINFPLQNHYDEKNIISMVNRIKKVINKL